MQSHRVRVAESINQDHGRVSEWRGLWRMNLNASKTKTMIVLRSPPLIISRTVLKEPDDLNIFEVTFGSEMTFEKHFRSASRASFQRLGISRLSWRIVNDRLLQERCFRNFVLPALEYCSAV